MQILAGRVQLLLFLFENLDLGLDVGSQFRAFGLGRAGVLERLVNFLVGILDCLESLFVILLEGMDWLRAFPLWSLRPS